LLLRSRGFFSRRDRDSSLWLFVLLDIGSSPTSVEVFFWLYWSFFGCSWLSMFFGLHRG
jgi:hypothetical protein